jgi:hypothetical protein
VQDVTYRAYCSIYIAVTEIHQKTQINTRSDVIGQHTRFIIPETDILFADILSLLPHTFVSVNYISSTMLSSNITPLPLGGEVGGQRRTFPGTSFFR